MRQRDAGDADDSRSRCRTQRVIRAGEEGRREMPPRESRVEEHVSIRIADVVDRRLRAAADDLQPIAAARRRSA